VRGQTLALKRREFVGAAQALGLSDRQIIRRHIIPNTIGPVIVFVTVVVPKDGVYAVMEIRVGDEKPHGQFPLPEGEG